MRIQGVQLNINGQTYELRAEQDEGFIDLSRGIEEYLKKQDVSLRKGFQRDIDFGRINEIKKYIIENEYGIIPNSVIVNLVAIEVESEDDLNATIADKQIWIQFCMRIISMCAGIPSLF